MTDAALLWRLGVDRVESQVHQRTLFCEAKSNEGTIDFAEAARKKYPWAVVRRYYYPSKGSRVKRPTEAGREKFICQLRTFFSFTLCFF